MRPKRFAEAFVGYHWVLAGVATTAYWVIGRQSHFDVIADLRRETRSNVYLSLAGTSGVLLGFAITAVTIFLSLGRGRGLDLLRTQQDFPYVRRVLMGAIYAFGVSTLWMTAMLVVDAGEQPRQLLEAIAAGVVTLAFLRTSALLWLLNRLLRLAIADAQSLP